LGASQSTHQVTLKKQSESRKKGFGYLGIVQHAVKKLRDILTKVDNSHQSCSSQCWIGKKQKMDYIE